MSRTLNQLRFSTFATFPTVGANNTLYLATDTDTLYWWNGSAYATALSGSGATGYTGYTGPGNFTGYTGYTGRTGYTGYT